MILRPFLLAHAEDKLEIRHLLSPDTEQLISLPKDTFLVPPPLTVMRGDKKPDSLFFMLGTEQDRILMKLTQQEPDQ